MCGFFTFILMGIGIAFLAMYPSKLEQIDSSCSALDRLIAREFIHDATIGMLDIRGIPKSFKDVGFDLFHKVTGGASVADSMLKRFKEENKIKVTSKLSDGKYSLEDEIYCTFAYYNFYIPKELARMEKRNSEQQNKKNQGR